jgi:hypothetical protein
MSTRDPAALLRNTLASNAVFSSLCGLGFLVAGQGLGDAFGAPPAALEVFGLALLGFAVYVWLVARRDPIRRGEGWAVWIMDVGYVLASAAVLMGSPHLLSGTGRLFFSVAADAVAVFAVLEYMGLRRLISAAGQLETKGEALTGSR